MNINAIGPGFITKVHKSVKDCGQFGVFVQANRNDNAGSKVWVRWSKIVQDISARERENLTIKRVV
jgi:hypothetical protein